MKTFTGSVCDLSTDRKESQQSGSNLAPAEKYSFPQENGRKNWIKIRNNKELKKYYPGSKYHSNAHTASNFKPGRSHLPSEGSVLLKEQLKREIDRTQERYNFHLEFY